MKSEKETIYDYAAELKLLAFKEELECTLSLAQYATPFYNYIIIRIVYVCQELGDTTGEEQYIIFKKKNN